MGYNGVSMVLELNILVYSKISTAFLWDMIPFLDYVSSIPRNILVCQDPPFENALKHVVSPP